MRIAGAIARYSCLIGGALVIAILASCDNPVNGGGDPGNRPPSVSGAASVDATLGGDVNLEATASDPDDDPLTFTWSIVSQPAGSSLENADISNGDTLKPAFMPTHAGTYELLLSVSDGVHSASMPCTITVAVSDEAPTLISPANGTATRGREVTLVWKTAAGATAYTTCFGPSATDASQVYSGTATETDLGGLADGEYRWWVTATTDDGRIQSHTRSFRIDNVAPTLDITEGPSGPTNDPTPSFAFSAGSDSTLVECSVDGEPYVDCASETFTAASLDDGPHEFSVRAVDAAGNTALETRSFSVDTFPPGTPGFLHRPSDTLEGASTVELDFGYIVLAGEPPDNTFECRFFRTDIPGDPPPWESCTSPARFDIVYPAEYFFEVRAVDPAGNLSDPLTHDFDNEEPGD